MNNNTITNENLLYYAVDSSVYSSFEKIEQEGTLLSVCDGRAVLTPKIEQEIFGVNRIWDIENNNSANNTYVCNKWIRVPTKIGVDNSCQTNFYLANPDYSSTESNSLSTKQYYDALKSDADIEIATWATCNIKNTVLFSNDQKMVRLTKGFGVKAIGSIGVLMLAIEESIVDFSMAECIYNKWSIDDRGSCLWENRKLISFEDIYLKQNI